MSRKAQVLAEERVGIWTAQAGLQIAFAHDRTVHDCLYVALAVQAGSVVITADEKLANALAAYLPVKWLGSFY